MLLIINCTPLLVLRAVTPQVPQTVSFDIRLCPNGFLILENVFAQLDWLRKCEMLIVFKIVLLVWKFYVKPCWDLKETCDISSVENNRPLHGFRRHLGCGAVVAKITANVWEILQLSTLITP